MLFQGALLALEQAGLLLRDATLLFENGRWASALVLSVFCLEELGKSDMLVEKTKLALAGQPITYSMLTNAFDNHEAKLKRGRSRDTAFAGRAFIGELPSVETPEFDALLKQMDKEERKALKRASSESHTQRIAALYVNLLPEQVWSRPKDTKRGDALMLTTAAYVEYGKCRSRLVRGDDPELKQLCETFEKWLQALQEPAATHLPDPTSRPRAFRKV